MRESLVFADGDQVDKPTGYPFPGVVRAAFHNGEGKARYVVEHAQAPGLLHIFNGKQLERAK